MLCLLLYTTSLEYFIYRILCIEYSLWPLELVTFFSSNWKFVFLFLEITHREEIVRRT